MSDQPAAQATFPIGEVFPAEDPVARFLSVIAMNTNDLIRVQLLFTEHEEPGTRLLLLRIDAALLWEIATFIDESRASPEVTTFLDGLPRRTRDLLSSAMEGVRGTGQTSFGKELAHIRNQMFHYPGIRTDRPDREPLHRALTSAADLTGSLGGQPVENFRFGFADEIAVKLLSRSAAAEDAELAELAAELVIRTGAFREFADQAVSEYLSDPSRASKLHVTTEPQHD